MANYSITNPQARLSLVRLVEIPQVAAPPPPWLAVSPDPGPVLADVPPRVGGQPGAWQAPLTIQRSPVGVPVGIREAAIASLPPAGYANGTGFLEGLTASLPDLTVNGIATGLGGNVAIPVAVPSTDINTAVDVSSFDCLGSTRQTWPASSLTPTAINLNGAKPGSGSPYALGTIPAGGVEISGSTLSDMWDWHYFSFTAPSSGPMVALLTSSAPNATLNFYDQSGNSSIGSQITAGAQVLTAALTGGTGYRMRVVASSAPSYPATYSLKLLPLVQPTYYYRITTSKPGRFRFTGDCSNRAAGLVAGIRNLSGSSDKPVYGTGGLNSEAGGSPYKYVSYPAGDWYLYTCLYSPEGGEFTLSAFFTAAPGREVANAWDFGTQPDGQAFTYSGWCSTEETTSDGWFKFTTTAAGSRTVSCTTSQIYNSYYPGYAPVTLQLYASNGTTRLTSASNTLTYSLSASTTYYLYYGISWGYAYAVGRCFLNLTLT